MTTTKPSSSTHTLSSKEHYYKFRSLTPPRIRCGKPMGRSFPQSLPDIVDYPQDDETGLYIEDNFDFIYKQNLQKIDVISKRINQADFVIIKGYRNKEYVYKSNSVLEDYLPEKYKRDVKTETLVMQISSNESIQKSKNIYHSHSRVMMQIMLRDLLALFLKDRTDVLLPKIYPIVDKDNGEVCGMMSEKINFQEGQSVKSQIIKKIQETGIPSLMKILGIEDIINEYEINNVGITQDKKNKKLVFFDFGKNFLDCEYLKRYSAVNLKNIHYHHTYLGKSLRETREKYLQGYHTTNDANGLAETVHPDIENIIMSRGSGDENFRKDMAKIIQTRINNAFILG